MTTHTPGPWEANDWRFETILDSERVWAVFANEAELGHKMPCECHGPDAEANARLIAAAPDLLEAIDVMLDRFDEGSGACALTPSKRRAVEKARAAITKATGGAE